MVFSISIFLQFRFEKKLADSDSHSYPISICITRSTETEFNSKATFSVELQLNLGSNDFYFPHFLVKYLFSENPYFFNPDTTRKSWIILFYAFEVTIGKRVNVKVNPTLCGMNEPKTRKVQKNGFESSIRSVVELRSSVTKCNKHQ